MARATIRQVIEDACEQEQRDPALRRFFETRLTDLQSRLVLPANDPLGALEHFSWRYIDFVPELLALVREHAAYREADSQIDAFLSMAEDFFLAPPDAVHGIGGLQGLMDEAFLAQRLIEEVNDRFIRCHGRPLINMDMTRANIIAHHLVGEPHASGLENLVTRSVEQIASRCGLFEQLSDCRAEAPAAELALPCMSRDVAVDLRLDA